MKSVKIKLDTIDKVKEFAGIATNYADDLDLVSGRYVIDAKSIMGIFSMNLSKALELVVHGADDTQIEAFINSVDRFLVK